MPASAIVKAETTTASGSESAGADNGRSVNALSTAGNAGGKNTKSTAASGRSPCGQPTFTGSPNFIAVWDSTGCNLTNSPLVNAAQGYQIGGSSVLSIGSSADDNLFLGVGAGLHKAAGSTGWSVAYDGGGCTFLKGREVKMEIPGDMIWNRLLADGVEGGMLSLVSLTEWRTLAAKGVGLRRVLLPIFRRFNLGDVIIRHHWTGDPIVVHSFKHKGYWYRGRRREYDTMVAFRRLLNGGDIVIDVGAHIGYIAVFFGDLVGSSGHVYAFEPGLNNLPYTRRNCANCHYRNISLIEMAISSSEGCASLYVEALSGQNNSLVENYEVFAANARSAGSRAETAAAEVQTIRLDSYVEQHALRPALVKIDVEGAEAAVLNGATNILRLIRPVLMVEVTQRHSEVTKILFDHDYRLFTPTGDPIAELQHKASDIPVSGNMFAIPMENCNAIVRLCRDKAPQLPGE